MKQAIKTTTMITMGLFTLCTMGLSQARFAGLKTDNPIELKFIGKVESLPVFQLNLINNEKYFITVKDENSNLLYSEKVVVKQPNFSRKYQLDIDEADLTEPGFGIRVEVTSAKTNKKQIFKISANTTVIENILVAKL